MDKKNSFQREQLLCDTDFIGCFYIVATMKSGTSFLGYSPLSIEELTQPKFVVNEPLWTVYYD
jgi:hypothetical protein